MVAESILRIPLEDLTTIRIKCAKCGLVTEGPFTEHNKIVLNGKCSCGQQIQEAGTVTSDLFQFTTLAQALLNQSKLLSIEFVVADPGK
jgi:hypothetical protein